jgi:hypothetical protein
MTVTPAEDSRKEPADRCRTDEAAVLEGYAVGVDELEVGNTALDRSGLRPRPREAFLEEGGKARERLLAPRHDLLRRAIRPEEPFPVEFVAGDQRRDPARQPGVPGQGGVLRQRQFEPRLGLGQRGAGAGGEEPQFDDHRPAAPFSGPAPW